MSMTVRRSAAAAFVLSFVGTTIGCDVQREEDPTEIAVPTEGEAMPDVNVNIEGDPAAPAGDTGRVDQIDVQIGDEGVGVVVE